MTFPKISVVIPVYGCKDLLAELYLRLSSVLPKVSENYEIILVNDGGPDHSWQAISELCKKDNKVKGVNLSRNFGQHAAITAGLQASQGDWVVVMDCDLQDKPEEIINLYRKAKEGYDMVFAKREIRKDGFFKKLFSKWFYNALAYFTETSQDPTIGNFGIYSRQTIESVLAMGDKFRFFPAMVKWTGLNHTAIEVEHSERPSGKSAYSFKKLLVLGLNTILTFSDKPLRLTVKLGLIMVVFSIIFSVFTFYRYFTGQILELGYTSLIISIWFLAGIIIFILGVVGLYVGRTFDTVKNRPLYLVKENLNLDE